MASQDTQTETRPCYPEILQSSREIRVAATEVSNGHIVGAISHP